MDKILISYFSATGATKRAAERIQSATNGDLFEIEPIVKYNDGDLDWTNKNSRSSIEMKDKNSRPKIKNKVNNIDEYNIVIIGFPVWWYTAPTIVNNFIEQNNLRDKKIFIFVTSGGSGYEGSFEHLKETYPALNFVAGRRFNGTESNADLLNWLNVNEE